MKKRVFLLAFFFVLSFLFTTKVRAIPMGSFDCSNEEYQCISCSYERQGGAHHFTYYVKSNEEGALSITGEGPENSVEYDYSSESSYFLNSEKNGLICPTVYMQGGSMYTDKFQLKITFTKLPDVHIDDFLAESLPATLTVSDDNKKPFKKDTGSGTEIKPIVCENIKMMKTGYAKQNTTEMVTLQETARVVVTGNVVQLELPSPYRINTDVGSSGVGNYKASDFKDGCPKDLLVTCTSLTEGAHGDTDTFCQLIKGSELDERFIDADTKKPVNATWSDLKPINWDDIKYTGDCNDVKDLRVIWLIITIGAPFLVIVLGSIDFFKNVVTTEGEARKKNNKRFIRRIIALVILLITPFIIKLLVGNLVSRDNAASNIKLMNCIVNGK